ncbi:unnamed protein product, partial [Rotaria sp. Silwood2]
MEDSTPFENSSNPDLNIDTVLSNRLEELKQKFSERFTISIYALKAVHNNVPDELKERLMQIREKGNGQCMILIPYNVEGVHWTGILLKFKTEKQIELIQFLDPVENSKFHPEKILNQLATIYPNTACLRWRPIKKHSDPRQSKNLTIENLLKAAEEVQFTNVQNKTGMSHSYDRTFDDSNASSSLNEEDGSNSTLTTSVTIENLKNLYNDFHSMPHCSERSIINLLYLFSLKLIGRVIVSDNSILIPDQIETEIAEQLTYLKERLKIEELQSIEMRDLVKTCLINVKDENWQVALITMRKLFNQISPLNMQELFRLIEKFDDASHLIKEKDIILFLGETGSGKSTTIHFLAGSQMKHEKVNGLDHIIPINVRNPYLKKITTSSFTQSETRYITPVPVNVGGHTDGDIILCDTPGFENNYGAEVDIANGICIIRVVKECKSVKPVVIISNKSIGDRCHSMKKLVQVIVGLIPGIQDNIKTISYIFTKFPDSQKKAIHTYLNDIKEKLNEEMSNIGFMIFLKDMLQKARKSIRVLDPINDQPEEVLNELVESPTISYPNEVFQYFITEKSKAIVQEQIRKILLSVMSATKRYECPFVQYKLDQLKRLNNLLEFDYIEQIYNDCIRYISQHISEEYQNGTSKFNYCLINQTILRIDDIEQYRTYVDHAKLTDILRSNYLGKEVIHSSAFIQYLNQQIDIIVKSLHEKDIDDLSTKNSLDKIKLVAIYFPDIDSKYKNACQIFSNKHEFIVKSFNKSMLQKNIADIIRYIIKLNDACTILENHLDREYMTRKYEEIKIYFLQYLHELVEKLSHRLSQENYENEIIESLEECTRIFDTTINIATLQSNILTKDINQIYEDFLLKLMNHYEQIDKQIIEELKNKCSFRELEQLFKKMILLRTIPYIQLRTHHSYYSTLEQICNCIKESRKEIEEILNGFYHNKKTNYNHIMKCLSNFKNARWIEKYEFRMYYDLIDDYKIEIIRYIKELEKSIMQTNLDLDNWHKIEFLDNIISEINEMRVIEEIVPNIVQHIENINSQYKNEIENVLTIINNTFNSEEKISILDFSIAEKVFHYLNVCRRINVSFENDYTLVINKLKKFINEFSNVVQYEMKQYFIDIKQYENENRKDIFYKVLKLLSRFKEISEIKNKYPQVFSCFQNQKIIENWECELEYCLIDKSNEMTFLNTLENTEIIFKLLIIKALSNLDRFLYGKKFNDIYYEYYHKFLNRFNDRIRQVIEDINTFKYENVVYDMKIFQTSNEVGNYLFAQVKQILNINLFVLMEETKIEAIMIGNTSEIQEIHSIVKNLRRMQNAKIFLSEYIDKTEEIDHCINDVKKLIEERIKLILVDVNVFIKTNNFYEIEQKINFITIVSDLLGPFCTNYIFEQIEELNKNLDKIISNIVERYREMDISAYILNPPTDICDKLEKIRDRNLKYTQVFNVIKELILNKFRKELDEAKKKQPPNPINIHIRKFESRIKYLPKDMQECLEIEVKYCKDDIQKNMEYNIKNLKDTCDSRDLKHIKKMIQDYQQTEGMQYYVNQGRVYVLQQTRDIALKINDSLQDYKINEALDHIEILYDYNVELENLFNIEQSCSYVRLKVTEIFQEIYLCCMKYFLNNNGNILIDEMTE